MQRKRKKVSSELVPIERLERQILVIRGLRVMLDQDLATVYGVSTTRLNEQVRRNLHRFPRDFAFLLTRQEFADLKSQFARSSSGWGGRRKVPFAFTEHGALMAANVLQSPTAVRASIAVVRAFVRLREVLASSATFSRKLAELERRLVQHDQQFATVFEAIRQLMEPVPGAAGKKPVGF